MSFSDFKTLVFWPSIKRWMKLSTDSRFWTLKLASNLIVSWSLNWPFSVFAWRSNIKSSFMWLFMDFGKGFPFFSEESSFCHEQITNLLFCCLDTLLIWKMFRSLKKMLFHYVLFLTLLILLYDGLWTSTALDKSGFFCFCFFFKFEQFF